jgi:hypothetical protein
MIWLREKKTLHILKKTVRLTVTKKKKEKNLLSSSSKFVGIYMYRREGKQKEPEKASAKITTKKPLARAVQIDNS